jgi:hypothetical protein
MDLRERVQLTAIEKPTFTNQIRKQVRVTDCAELIEEMFRKTIGLKT